MGREISPYSLFGKKVRRLREERDWSQTQFARMLKTRGIDHIIGTTIAKIERGSREVKLDEAAAMADLFEVSLDDLATRDSRRRREEDLAYYLRQLRDNARRYAGQAADLSWSVVGDVENVSLDGVPDEIADAWQEVFDCGERVARELEGVAYDLGEIANDVTEILSLRSKGDKR